MPGIFKRDLCVTYDLQFRVPSAEHFERAREIKCTRAYAYRTCSRVSSLRPERSRCDFRSPPPGGIAVRPIDGRKRQFS